MANTTNENPGCIAIGITIMVFVFLICGLFSNCINDGNANNRNNKHKAWVEAQYYVETQLKNPRSAKFEYGGASKAEVSGNTYIFRSYVDATNSFGGTIRTYFFCKLRKKYDDSFELLQLDFSKTPYGAYPTY